MKLFNENEKYMIYYNYVDNVKLITQYYVNNTISINNINFDLVNKNIYKTLIRITNKVIQPNFIYTLNLYNLLNNNNELFFNEMNEISYNSIFFTNTYYTNLFKIEFIFDELKYYIILNLCFYNEKSIETYTNDVFISDCNLIENFCLMPTLYNFTNQFSIFQNTNNLTTKHSKYYYYFINYDKLSNNTTNYNIRPINHYYMNIPNIIISLKSNNVINILPSLINNLIYDIILINTFYPELKNNIYDMPSTLILSLILDNNIEKLLVNEIYINDELYKNITLKLFPCKRYLRQRLSLLILV